MSRPLVRDYSFTTADHWQAGARHNFELVGDQLDVPQPRCLRLLDDLGPTAGSTMSDLGPCGRLTWLRPKTRELVSREDLERLERERELVADD